MSDLVDCINGVPYAINGQLIENLNGVPIKAGNDYIHYVNGQPYMLGNHFLSLTEKDSGALSFGRMDDRDSWHR